jgi:hypothetical protein
MTDPLPALRSHIMGQIVLHGGVSWENLFEDRCVHDIIMEAVGNATPEEKDAFVHFHGEEAHQHCISEYGNHEHSLQVVMQYYLLDCTERWYRHGFPEQVLYLNSLMLFDPYIFSFPQPFFSHTF